MHIKNNIAISDSGFIFNPGSGESFSVNPISRKIMQWIKEEKSQEEIIEMILENYAIDRDTVEKDLYDFMELLKLYHLTEEEQEENEKE